MSSIEEKVKQFIIVNKLIDFSQPIIVGVSGGPDSIALLSILIHLNITCIAAHCNFHLRGAESDRDMQFVENFCQKNGVKLYTTHFDTKIYAATRHISIEMAARELRYQWFESLRQKLNINSIAIAHHSDDIIETFFINILRGSGIHGLTGIKCKNGAIVRPLLCISRQDILDYLKDQNQSFVTDSSNNSNDYLRNKIRNIIIPNFVDAAPSAKKSILKTISILRESEMQLSTLSRDWNKKYIKIEKEITKVDLSKLYQAENKQFILFELLRPYGITAAIASEILECGFNESGKIFYTKTHAFIKDRHLLEIHDNLCKDNTVTTITLTGDNTHVSTPISLTFTIENIENVVIEKNKVNCYVDIESLQMPLSLRHWKYGDAFSPFGKKQMKKLSDFFISEKMSLSEKNSCFLLTDANDNIIWIVGKRADNRFRITNQTKKVLHISL